MRTTLLPLSTASLSTGFSVKSLLRRPATSVFRMVYSDASTVSFALDERSTSMPPATVGAIS